MRLRTRTHDEIQESAASRAPGISGYCPEHTAYTLSDQRRRESIARAAAQDAADRNMRKHGRTAWNRDDYNIACAELERLLPSG